MSFLTLFLFVWGFGISIYLIAIGVSRIITKNIATKIDNLEKNLKLNHH